MQLTQVHLILEVRNSQPTSYVHFHEALDRLRGAALGGCPVVFVFSTCDDPPTQVPSFGYSHRLTRNPREPHGVSRYFGHYALVVGRPSCEIFGTYKLSDEARVEVCGTHTRPLEIPASGEPLERIEFFPAPESKDA